MRSQDARRIAALVLLSLIPLHGCGVIVRHGQAALETVRAGGLVHPGRIAPLDDSEKQWAKTAWRYFSNNTAPETGLVSGQDRGQTVSVWEMADYLAALVSARRLELIDANEFDQRLSQFLGFLGRMDLVDGQAPNRLYSTVTGRRLDANGQPGETGWSAVDLARLMLWLRIAGEHFPAYQEYLDKAVYRLRLCNVIDQCGRLYAGARQGDQVLRSQEGRLGMEEYAAAGYQTWGYRATEAALVDPADPVQVDNRTLWADRRDPRQPGGEKVVIQTTPYVLTGIELGWDSRLLPGRTAAMIREQSETVYRVQEDRWRREGIYSARAEHQSLASPYRLTDSIFANGYAWNTLSDTGQWYPRLGLVSTKAVFGLWVLWDTDYTDRLMDVTRSLFDKDRGWYEGRYEATGAYERAITASTNAMVLESLLYKTTGPLLRQRAPDGYFSKAMANPFSRPEPCPAVPCPACAH